MRLANAPSANGGRLWEVSILSISKWQGQYYPRQPLLLSSNCCMFYSTYLRCGCGDSVGTVSSMSSEQQCWWWPVSSQGRLQGPGSDHLTTAWCCHVVMLSAASTSSLSCNLSSRLHNGNWSANLLILNSNWRSIVREPIIWRRYHFSITHYPQLNLKRVL